MICTVFRRLRKNLVVKNRDQTRTGRTDHGCKLTSDLLDSLLSQRGVWLHDRCNKMTTEELEEMRKR